jgi:glutamate dehydrogenase/leucine dehydrogenase
MFRSPDHPIRKEAVMTAQDFLPLEALEEEFDACFEATLRFEEAARALDLEDWIVQRLRHPEREASVNLVLVRDNGQTVNFTGLRVQHSTARGPTLGGIRISPHAQLSQTRALAMEMTWQCALLDIPFGGAAGAIVCDPRQLSERELCRVSKDYVRALRGILGSGTDVLMPDGGSNPQVLSWMLDEHAHIAGRLEPSAVMGKPAALFGLPHHSDAAAQGVIDVLALALAEQGRTFPGLRVVLQGFGQTGAALARLLHEAGARIVAAADVSGGLRCDDGLPVPVLLEWAAEKNMLFGFPEADAACNTDVLEAECDVLILAAVPRQVNRQNAAHLRAPLLIEAIHGAVTKGADEVLEHHNVVVLPSILAGAGAAAAAYVEWSRNLGRDFLLDGVEDHIRLLMQNAYRDAREAAQLHETGMRQATMLLAVERLAAALRLR